MEESMEPGAPAPRRGTLASTIKLAVLGALVLLLLLPVASVLGLVHERQGRASQVRQEIGRLWGQSQTVGAAVLTVPYRSADGGRIVVRRLQVLPRELRWSGRLEPSIRSRGIFHVPVYVARLRAQGWFEAPDVRALGVDPAAIDWGGASLTLGVSDLRGLQGRVGLDLGGTRLALTPGTDCPALAASGLRAPVGDAGLSAGRRLRFTSDLELRGTEALSFLPLGDTTLVDLASTWPDPGFGGAALPRRRTIEAGGFTARWEVPYFGRGFPRVWREDRQKAQDLSRAAARSAFGVTLVRPADEYQQTERSVKYAVLFIGLTFTVLFLMELLSAVRLHPVQYLLVGFALCLFYVLLLALEEHVGFFLAYLLASTAVVVQVGLYARSLLGSWRRVAPLAGALSCLYGYLYSLLVFEDSSLLFGAISLFAVLGVVMYLTRNLDWWTLRFPTKLEQ